MTANESYSAYVRLTECAFPRGGRWLFFYWFAVMFAVLVWVNEFSAAIVAAVFVVFALAATYISRQFDRGAVQALSADPDGITFGSRGRPSCHLSWADIQELRISQLRRVVLLEILTAPSVEVRYRGLGWQIAQLVLAALPFGLQRSVPALVTPVRCPASYRIPLLRVSAEDLRAGLAAVAPGTPIVIAS